MAGALPYRGDGSDRPAQVLVPPARMPLVQAGRPRKSWTYAAAFGERLMLCAATARIGPLPQSFWAVWDRERRELRERTRMGPLLARGVTVAAPAPGREGRLVVRDGPLRCHLSIEPGAAVETASPHGRAWIWTRKQGGVRLRGRVEIAGEAIDLDARGCVDESAGYHARQTSWRWSAGVGALEDGAAVGWNLVSGLHDAVEASERTVWIAGSPHHVGPVTFAADLSSVSFSDGAELRFAAEAERRRRDDLRVFRSDYAQPFGTFAGSLPRAGALAWGLGVMERHSALW